LWFIHLELPGYISHHHHHHHVPEGLGVFPVPWSSRWSWFLHLFLGRPMFLRPFGLYCSACFGSLCPSSVYVVATFSGTGYISRLTLLLDTPDRVIICKDLGLLLLTLYAYIYKHKKMKLDVQDLYQSLAVTTCVIYSLASECPFKCIYIHKALNIFTMEVQMFCDITLRRMVGAVNPRITPHWYLKTLRYYGCYLSPSPSPVFVITLINLLLMVIVVSTNTAFPLWALMLLTPHKRVRHDEIRRTKWRKLQLQDFGVIFGGVIFIQNLVNSVHWFGIQIWRTGRPNRQIWASSCVLFSCRVYKLTHRKVKRNQENSKLTWFWNNFLATVPCYVRRPFGETEDLLHFEMCLPCVLVDTHGHFKGIWYPRYEPWWWQQNVSSNHGEFLPFYSGSHRSRHQSSKPSLRLHKILHSETYCKTVSWISRHLYGMMTMT